jgi:hypothetical protein
MKKLLFASLLLLGASLQAQSIIVYAKGDFTLLEPNASAPQPADPARAAFLTAVQADFARPQAFAAPLKLIAPPAWGRTVPGAHGLIQFHDSFSHGFVVKVTLEGLAPDHRYILTLNGNPKLAGNDRLVDAVPGMATERYYDFLTATTDAQGRYQASFGILLPAGPYDVRFYVKDTADFKIVLYHDYFKFAVE